MDEKGSPPEASRAEPVAEGAPNQGFALGELRDHVPAEIRTVSFPVSVRGYNRLAVDAYVERVNRVIAELEVGRSPRSAVRHALDRVTEQVRGILEQAREAAEQIASSAREEAEESTAQAKAEAAELVVEASAEADRTRAEAGELLAKAKGEAEEILARSRGEAEGILTQARTDAAEHLRRSEEDLAALRERAETQLQELQADTEAVGERRRLLLADIRGTAAQLEELAGEAAARFPLPEPAEPEEEVIPGPEADAETGASGVAGTEGLEEAMPPAAAREGGGNEPTDEEAADGKRERRASARPLVRE